MVVDTDKVNITSLSEEFESSGVTVLLEWTRDSTRVFNVIVTPWINMTFNGTSIVQIRALYNTQYNISIVTEHPCGQRHTTTLIELYYSECMF